MDIRFEHLRYVHLLWIVAALLALTVYGFARKRRALQRFATISVLGDLLPDFSLRRQWLKAVLVLAGMAVLVGGVIDPRWGVYWEEVPRRGVDIIFVLDVSRSMLAEDVAPNRLERAKQDIRDMLEVLGGDRVGLVTFAGVATLKCPLTTNYGSFRMTLDEVGTQAAARGGTLLGDAVRVAAESFVDPVKKYKLIVVLSDGEDQGSYPVEAARKVQTERGIRVFTVGLGDASEGARVPLEQAGPKTYLQHNGQEVWTKMDPTTLQQMALAGDGAYIPAGTRIVDLGQIYQERMAPSEQREFESSRVQVYKVRYQWFAGLALALLLIETAVSACKRIES